MQESIVPKIYTPQTLDEKINVHDEDAFETARKLALRKGFLSA